MGDSKSYEAISSACYIDQYGHPVQHVFSEGLTTRPDGSQFGKCDKGHWRGMVKASGALHIRMPGKERRVRVTISTAACTASCWYAKGQDCCCSCGGKNHGIERDPSISLK